MALSSWIRSWKHSVERRWALYKILRRKTVARRRAARPRLEALEERWLLSAYTVTSAADDGSAGTLRYGITQANAPGSTITEIDFNIGTVGSAQTISITSQLPALTANGVFINGLSQGSSGNTKQLITLDGTNAGSGSEGLPLLGSGCIVSGLIVEHFDIGIDVVGSKNTIGGTATGAGNIISGNTTDGVLIEGASGVAVQGNYVGTTAAGNAALANIIGIEVDGSGNMVGGTASGARNLISGNSVEGVLLNGTSNQVLGNYIGTNAAGNAALPNQVGIDIRSSNNTVGSSGARNLISGNSSDGVELNGSGNQVLGNYIGTNAAGNAALPNASSGIDINSNNNTIGGTASGASNLISGNSGDGMHISDTGSGTLVLGNFIGTNAAGNAALPNVGSGIDNNSNNNTIGGTASGARNLISGNSGGGVLIGDAAISTQVLGNFVGTNAAGKAALPNAGNGIDINTSNNTIGGTAPGAGNLISGNGRDGVFIGGDGSGNQVLGNYIGTNAAGNAAVANALGVEVATGNGNSIGGTASGARNLISGNTYVGVFIGNGTGTQVMANYIGTDATGAKAVPNSVGVEMNGSANTLGGTATGAGNLISGNSSDGVLIYVSGVAVQGNYIGTDATGANAVANSIGVELGGSNSTVGGTASGARNIISGNTANGVLIDGAVSGVAVQGNFIGTDITGAKAIANGIGVWANESSAGTIGGTSAAARNIISGNTNDGLLLGAANGSGAQVQVQGNYIGTDVTGTTALANGSGIEVTGIFTNSTIGGAVTGAGNVISGNTDDGVLIDSGVSGVVVQGNYIGTNAAGNAALANSRNGVEVDGNDNTIGGTTSGARNVISGNSSDGVLLNGSANQVLGNSIGINAAGTAALPNGGTAALAIGRGIFINGNSNTVGSSASGAGNLISGNNGDGVLIEGSANQVLGNSIGTNAAGNAALPNAVTGIDIDSENNTVGGSAAGAGNLISGNGFGGVHIGGDSGNSNLVLGNSIGTNAAGNAALPNSGSGIDINGNNNTVGGSAAGAGNLISGNSGDGVHISVTYGSNLVLGNSIGTNAAGNAALANAGGGIFIDGNSNTVGGSAAGARNLVSGNGYVGVHISGDGNSNEVLGNFVGTNAAGNAALANAGGGIVIDGNSNTLGGSASGAGNLISGNSGDGVLINRFVSGTQVLGNSIGTNAAGNAALANSVGIEVFGPNNTIGGTTSDARNVISGNTTDGVLIDKNVSGVAVQGNSIGTDISGAALGNGHYGVNISGNKNLIGGSVASAGNIIADNTQGGVLVSTGSGNTIRHNSIFANGSTHTGPGITLSSGANNNLAAPALHAATFKGGTLTVHGSFMAPTANVGYVLDFFANPTGDAEGKIYLGSLTVTPTRTGTIPFTFTTATTMSGTNPLITATLTDASGDTSSFSNGVKVSSPPPNNPPPSPPSVLNVPPLLAFINSLFSGGIETVNHNGIITITDYLFGIPLLVSTFNSSGQFMSVSLLGIDITFLFG